jgi:hypothetical protein
MANKYERGLISDLWLREAVALAEALEPFGQTLLTMKPDTWPEDAMAVRVAHHGFEVALEASRAVGHPFSLTEMAKLTEERREYLRQFPDGAPSL